MIEAAVGTVGRHLHDGAEVAQHPLRVVAGCLPLDHRGATRRVEAGQQNGGLDLRGGRGGLVGDRYGLAGPAQGQRHPSPLRLAHHGDPHFRQGVEDPTHGALAQGGVAIEGGGDRVTARHAHHQPRTRARIAEVQNVPGLREPADAGAPDPPPAGALAGNPGAESPAGLCGPQDVLPLEKALDPGLADRQQPEDHGAVRDRLVAGDAKAPLQGAPRPAGDRRCRAVVVRHSCPSARS